MWSKLISGSVFTHWEVARWAQKLRLEKKFELKDGRITVRSPGIYYLYAQVFTFCVVCIVLLSTSDQLLGRERRERVPDLCQRLSNVPLHSHDPHTHLDHQGQHLLHRWSGFKNSFSFYIFKSHVFFVLGGVTFLEHGDRVHVKNLDENRYFVSCLLASHLQGDVYGLSPLQQMGMMNFNLFTLGLNFAPAPCWLCNLMKKAGFWSHGRAYNRVFSGQQ